MVDAANEEGTGNLYLSVGNSDNLIADFTRAYPKVMVKGIFVGTANLPYS